MCVVAAAAAASSLRPSGQRAMLPRLSEMVEDARPNGVKCSTHTPDPTVCKRDPASSSVGGACIAMQAPLNKHAGMTHVYLYLCMHTGLAKHPRQDVHCTRGAYACIGKHKYMWSSGDSSCCAAATAMHTILCPGEGRCRKTACAVCCVLQSPPHIQATTVWVCRY